MMIVGQISTPEEAEMIESMVKVVEIGNRVRCLALKTKDA